MKIVTYILHFCKFCDPHKQNPGIDNLFMISYNFWLHIYDFGQQKFDIIITATKFRENFNAFKCFVC